MRIHLEHTARTSHHITFPYPSTPPATSTTNKDFHQRDSSSRHLDFFLSIHKGTHTPPPPPPPNPTPLQKRRETLDLLPRSPRPRQTANNDTCSAFSPRSTPHNRPIISVHLPSLQDTATLEQECRFQEPHRTPTPVSRAHRLGSTPPLASGPHGRDRSGQPSSPQTASPKGSSHASGQHQANHNPPLQTGDKTRFFPGDCVILIHRDTTASTAKQTGAEAIAGTNHKHARAIPTCR